MKDKFVHEQPKENRVYFFIVIAGCIFAALIGIIRSGGGL
jgi:hypothetical protein